MEELIEALREQTKVIAALVEKISQLISVVVYRDDEEEVPHPSKYLDGSSR